MTPKGWAKKLGRLERWIIRHPDSEVFIWALADPVKERIVCASEEHFDSPHKALAAFNAVMDQIPVFRRPWLYAAGLAAIALFLAGLLLGRMLPF